MKWLNDRSPDSVNCILFAISPSVTLKMWTDAYQWAAQTRKILQRPHPVPNCRQYSIATSINNEGPTDCKMRHKISERCYKVLIVNLSMNSDAVWVQ